MTCRPRLLVRVAQTFVWVAEGGREVVAYYSVNAHAVPHDQASAALDAIRRLESAWSYTSG